VIPPARIHPVKCVAVASVLLATCLLITTGVSAQSRGDTGLTGDPLVDSILQAPGPDFVEPRGRTRTPDNYFERPDTRARAPDEPDSRSSTDEDSFDEDWERAEPEPTPARRAMREPPPPPAPRGDGPLDIVILDTDSADEPTLRDLPDTSEMAAEDAPEEATSSADTLPETIPAPEEPFREQPAPPREAPERVASAPNTTQASEAPARTGPALDRMIGQMLLVGFPGTKPSQDSVRRLAQQLESGAAGGVILMSRNIESPQQVSALTAYLRDAAGDQATPFIAVDQEGGYVQRLARTKGFKTHPSAERLGARNDPQGAYSAYRNLALELRDYGFNLNLGPVVDLNLNPANPVIGRLKRSYGQDPDHVSAFAKAFVYAHNESGVLTAAKHFPGHGSSATDSHDVLVDVSESWTEAELRPYRKLIEAGAIDMIMTGHLYHPSFSEDPDTPVTLSSKGIERVLRDSMNYDGVVITDDLDMRGVRDNTTFDERIVGAVAAGNDILLITNSNGYQPDLPARVADTIRAAIADGRLSEDRIRQSYDRIMALKDELAELQRTATSAGEDRGLAGHSSGG